MCVRDCVLTGYEDEALCACVFTGYEDEAREHSTQAGRANDSVVSTVTGT